MVICGVNTTIKTLYTKALKIAMPFLSKMQFPVNFPKTLVPLRKTAFRANPLIIVCDTQLLLYRKPEKTVDIVA